jgi:DNA helicase-2/ATP-dependent DNA helicase PcrA
MIENIINTLNEEQRQAVLLKSGSALILAGAGSGKTRVLTSRIAALLASGAVQSKQILAVTFTNKAAKEMMTRLSALLPFELRSLWVGTFHGLSHRLLRLHWREAGLSQNFQILDMQDQLALIKRVLRELSLDEERFPARKVQFWINQQKEKGLRAASLDGRDYQTNQYIPIYQAYELQCAKENVVDFSELLLRSYELLRDHDSLKKHYQERFLHVLVDEYQDTNDLQVSWLKQLTGSHTSVFAVGDDDQSIYAFRGANTQNMARFRHDFQADHLIKLTQNYRSGGHILKAANAVISCNRDRLGKDLWTDQGDGELITVYEAGTDLQEAGWIVEKIQQLMSQNYSRDDVAILYRSNAQSRVIEHALFQAKIPYRVYGGLRFFDRAEIKHAMAYLRLIDRDDDDGAFLRVVNFPARGIGQKTLEQLIVLASEAQQGQGVPLLVKARELGGKFSAFVQLIDHLREKKQSLSLADLVALVIEDSGLVTQYRGEKDGEDRVNNLQELISAAKFFVEESTKNEVEDEALSDEVGELTRFLSNAALESGDVDSDVHERVVHLMTVHSAKGLEFKIVFVTGLEEGLFPHENSQSEPNGLEEERRLMYVAITRARERLFLSWAGSRQMHGRNQYHMASRFLEELPEEDTEHLRAKFNLYSRDHHASKAWDDWVSDLQNSAGQKKQEDSFSESRVIRGGDWGDLDLSIGRWVKHAHFGRGRITALEGGGQSAKVRVDFEQHGRKWLVLSVAKLEPFE